MENEFIKLTDSDDGRPLYVIYGLIRALAVTNTNKTALILDCVAPASFHVKETPEQIFKLIDAAKNIIKH